MIGRPRPISLAQALGYFLQESQGAGFEQLIEHADFPPEFGGALLAALGLKAGPISLADYTDFVMGDFPALRDTGLKVARASSCDPEELQRAVYEVTVSLPKSISLQLLMSGDTRMHEVVRDANTAVMKMFADYACVRVAQPNGSVEKVRVQGIAYASWFHISSREREPNETSDITGGADPQFHVHNLVHRLVLPKGSSELIAFEGKDVQIAHQATEAMS